MTTTPTTYDAIIIGGSYAGLSAAMALGRSLRKVLVLDSGLPCNRQTPYSHNFITQDGQQPAVIAAAAREQVLAYDTIAWATEEAVTAEKIPAGFRIHTAAGKQYEGRKLLLATGIRDEMPAIPGFAECWGISVLHCPYCHGYEVRGKNIALIGNGATGFEFARLISNWTHQLSVLTNGAATFSEEQEAALRDNGIKIIEHEISAFDHEQGHISQIRLKGLEAMPVDAIFSRVSFTQHCAIPEQLGCALNEAELINTDDFQRTTVPGVYAAGDNSTLFRSVAFAVAAGNKAGALLNKELIEETF